MNKTIQTKAFQNTTIPSDWEVKTLDECFRYLKTYTFSRNQLDYENNGNVIYNIHYGDIHSTFPRNILDVEKNINLIPRIINPELNEPELLKDGDLIMADASEDYEGIGQSIEIINIGDKKIIAGTHTFPLRPKSKFASKYAGYIFSSFYTHKELKKIATGISVYGLSKSNIAKIQLPIPPLPEQKAIAQVLSTWDNAIQKTEALLAQKELRKKWLMQQLLTGKKRLKGFGGEWKEFRLNDLFERVTRKNTEGNTNVITISAQRGFVKQTDFFNKRVASETLDNYFLVERGEFCYNKSYSNGYPWGATKRLNDFEKAVVTTLYICFKIKSTSEASGDFFEHFFGANLLDKGLTQIAHEGGRAHGLLNVTPSDFFSLKTVIPSSNEQTAIAEILQAADKEIELIKAKAAQLREQKKGLMQVLLTGKKRLI